MVNFAMETKIIAEKEASPLPSLVATSVAADASSKKGQDCCGRTDQAETETTCTEHKSCENVIARHDDDDALHDDHTHSVRFVKTVDVHVHNEVLGFNPSTKVGRQALHYTTRATTNVCASGCEKQLVLELAVNTSNLALPSWTYYLLRWFARCLFFAIFILLFLFDDILLLLFVIILSTQTGPPVQLGWKFEEHTADLKCCDGADAGSAGGIVLLSARDRHSMLLKEGFTSEEMTVREKSVQQIAKSIASSSSSVSSHHHHPTNPDGSTKKKVRRGTAYVKATPAQQLVQENTATNSIRSYAIDDSHKSVRVSELQEQQKKEQPTSASSTQQPSKSVSNANAKGALANKNPTSSSESGCCIIQ